MSQIWIHPRAIEIANAIELHGVEDAWKSDLPGQVINDRGDRQVIRIELSDLGRTVFMKRWRLASKSPFLFLPGKNELRTRGRSEFLNLSRLSEIEITVPQPLAFGETQG